MAALCLDASRETLLPLCCLRTLSLQGDVCCCLHKGSTQGLQAVVMLSAFHVLQNSPQFIVQGFEVCAPPKANSRHWWRPEGSSAANPELSGLLGRNWVLLEDPFLTTEEGHVKMFHNSLGPGYTRDCLPAYSFVLRARAMVLTGQRTLSDKSQARQ